MFIVRVLKRPGRSPGRLNCCRCYLHEWRAFYCDIGSPRKLLNGFCVSTTLNRDNLHINPDIRLRLKLIDYVVAVHDRAHYIFCI